jgi:hypothetical protein
MAAMAHHEFSDGNQKGKPTQVFALGAPVRLSGKSVFATMPLEKTGLAMDARIWRENYLIEETMVS